MLTGAALRLWNLSGVPSSLNQDEAVYAYDAFSIFHTGRDHHGHPFPLAGLESFGPFSGSVLSFLEAPVVGLFGLHVWSARVVPALFSLLAIPGAAWLGALLFESTLVGLIAAWIVALLPWDVENARFANLPAIVPAMAVLTLVLLIYALKHAGNRAIVWAALAASLSMATYHTMKVYLPLLAVAVIPIFWRSIRALSLEALAYAGLVVLSIGGPVLYLTAFDPSGRARASETMSTRSGLIPFLGHYLAYFSPSFLFTSGDGDPMHTPSGYGVLPWTLLPFLVIGAGALVHQVARPRNPWRRSAALFVLAALALYPFPGCFTTPDPSAVRAVHVIPILALIAAVGARTAVSWSTRGAQHLMFSWSTPLALIWIVPALIGFGGEAWTQYHNYFDDYPDEVATEFQYGLTGAVDYAIAHEATSDQIWVTGANQPYIYVLFEAEWSPTDVHQHLMVVRGAPGAEWVEAIGKFRFPAAVRGKPPSDIAAANLPILQRFSLPNGEPAFIVRGGTVAKRGRVLVIERASGRATSSGAASSTERGPARRRPPPPRV